MEAARLGNLTPALQRVAKGEGLAPDDLVAMVAAGTVVIPANLGHNGLEPLGVGKKLRTKVNANLGSSADYPGAAKELEKLRAAVDAGADAVMDLSTGGDIRGIRRAIMGEARVPVGTVPIYEAVVAAAEKSGSALDFTAEDLFRTIQEQAAEGVDFMTVHSGITREALGRLQREGRLADVVSRGGAFTVGWMFRHERENPLYAQFDRLLEIALKYDVVLSLGDSLRPGCLADATDRAQIQELIILGEMVDRARAAGVQVMVEGPGHVPLDQVEMNVRLQREICHEAPFYVLGPIVTDVAPGYDHITAAIDGAVAAAAGADFLCYVTPAEHLGLPTVIEVREGVVAARIAAHAGDLAKGLKGAAAWDAEMARARVALDWEKQVALAIDPVKARRYRDELNPVPAVPDRVAATGEAAATGGLTCSMCGPYCAMDLVAKYLGKDKGGAC